jgi:hypothetical protein
MALGIKALLEEVSGNVSRSTVLKPLGWALAVFVPATIVTAFLQLAPWLVGMFAGLTGFTSALYLSAYVFCLFRDRDALRSERYSLQKLAIEKQLIGDDRAGILELESPIEGQRLLGSDISKAKADK